MTHPVHHARRASLLAVLGALAALTIGLLTASPAQAANYQYWGYYQLADGAWTFAQKGPAETNPADASVEGWRWAITEESGTPPRNPRVTPTFEQVCGTAAAESGKKRVGVVIDYGRTSTATAGPLRPAWWRSARSSRPPRPAPRSSPRSPPCATATAASICGIDNYPASGCGGQVATLSPEQQAADTPATAGGAERNPGRRERARRRRRPAHSSRPHRRPPPVSSGVPVVVWVGLVILLLGVAALVWSAMRRRRQNV